MSAREASMDEMLLRTARFKDLKPTETAFVDSNLPGCERDVYTVIGRGVTENAATAPAIADVDGFNVTYIGAAPGKGCSMHSHDTVEVFFSMSGRWGIIWGDEELQQIELEPHDMVSVPAGVMRRFENVGDEYGYIMTICGGTDAGNVLWPKDVIEQARETGLNLDGDGKLVD